MLRWCAWIALIHLLDLQMLDGSRHPSHLSPRCQFPGKIASTILLPELQIGMSLSLAGLELVGIHAGSTRAYLSSSPAAKPDWGRAAHAALEQLLPGVLLFTLLWDLKQLHKKGDLSTTSSH
jgi:hypothetical protein